MTPLAWVFYFTNICCNITVAVLAIIACFYASSINDDEPKIDLFNVLFQIKDDWATQPFVRIESFDESCPADWEPVFQSQW